MQDEYRMYYNMYDGQKRDATVYPKPPKHAYRRRLFRFFSFLRWPPDYWLKGAVVQPIPLLVQL